MPPQAPKKKRSANEPVSVGYWFFAIFISALPLINLVVVPCLAIFGKDETKKNFFRAQILWFVVLVLLFILVHFGVIALILGQGSYAQLKEGIWTSEPTETP